MTTLNIGVKTICASLQHSRYALVCGCVCQVCENLWEMMDVMDFNTLSEPATTGDFCKENCMIGMLRVIPGNYDNDEIGLQFFIGHIDRATRQVILKLAVDLRDAYGVYKQATWQVPLTYDYHCKFHQGFTMSQGVNLSEEATTKIAGLLNSIHELEATDFSEKACKKRRLKRLNDLENRCAMVEVEHVKGSDIAKVKHWISPGWPQYEYAKHNYDLYLNPSKFLRGYLRFMGWLIRGSHPS